MQMDFTTCSKCGAMIRFVKMKSGKSMPVDHDTVKFFRHAEGKAKVVTESGEVVSAVLLGDDEVFADAEYGYISHFATCPYAARFRKGKASK